MQPLPPERRDEILRNRPQASPADLAEYERLCAARFTVDPSLPKSPTDDKALGSLEDRLQELYKKLFLD